MIELTNSQIDAAERAIKSVNRSLNIEKKTGVYHIRHVASGKRYIGSASRSFTHRWGIHRSDLRKGIHHSVLLQRAWNKYGEEAFEFTVLRITPPIEAVDHEQAFIDMYKACDPRFGYNVAPVAGSTLGLKMSEEFRTAVSARMKLRLSDPAELAAHIVRQKRSHGTPEYRKAQSERARRLCGTPEARAAASAKAKAQFANMDVRDENRRRQEETHRTPEYRAAASARARSQFASKDARDAASERTKMQMANPEARAAHSEKMRRLNADPIRKAIRVAKMNATNLRKKMRKASELLIVI